MFYAPQNSIYIIMNEQRGNYARLRAARRYACAVSYEI